MNIIEEAVVTKLLATTAVTNAVGQQVYPRMAPQNIDKPYIVINKVPGEQPAHKMSGAANFTIGFISVTCWGVSYKNASDIGSIVDTAINAKKETFGSVHVSFCLRQDNYDQSQLPALDDEVGNPGYRLVYKIGHTA